MALAKLPDGYYYAGRNFPNEVMDHHGHWYRVEYQQPQVSIPTPEKAKDWRANLPQVALSPEAFDHIKGLKEELSIQPQEYFAVVGIDVAGDPCFEDVQKGDAVHCTVDVDRIITKAKESQAVGVWAGHNHPYPHSAEMSKPDKDLTILLERKLAAVGKSLHEHVVVKGRQVEALASEMDYPSEWHKRQAEFEAQRSREPAWLLNIREGLEKRYAR